MKETKYTAGDGLHAWQDNETAKWLVSYTVQSSGREVVRGTFNYQSDAEAFARSGSLLAENERMREAIKAMFLLMDDGILVRDISEDSNKSSFLRQGLRITQVLSQARSALAGLEGE